jgi:hypothetical protein
MISRYAVLRVLAARDGKMANGNQKNVRVIGVLVLVIVVFVAWSSGLVAIEFEKDAPNKLPSTFGYLLLASLFVERAIEVFLSAWRSGEADAQDIQIKQTAAEIAAIKKAVADGTATADSVRDELDGLEDHLKKLESARIMYKADSRVIAQWIGLIIGFMVPPSVCGCWGRY